MSEVGSALALIKEFEGFRSQAYVDPKTGAEPVTIGYGTTVYQSAGLRKFGRSKVMIMDSITKQEAEEELESYVKNLVIMLKNAIKVTLKPHEFNAMVSFVYNLGFRGSALQIERLNKGKRSEFMAKHMEYIDKGTNVEEGLRRRRKAELDMFRGASTEKQWFNLVRHGTETEPEYRAYTMDGEACVSLKSFKTSQELINVLAKNRTAEVLIGSYGWHVAPAKASNPLSVPYFSQRDYGGPLAWSICGCTSVAMVLRYWGVKIDPDGVLKGWGKKSCQSPPGCEGVFKANKLKATHTYKGTWKQVRDCIDLGRPVVIHGMMTGSGHIMVVTGYDEKGYWCNDPAGKWGQVNGDSYSDNPKNGAGVYYREEAMWGACGGDNDVWYSVAWKG